MSDRPTPEVRAVLHAAADLIEKVGWCQKADAIGLDGFPFWGLPDRPATAHCARHAILIADDRIAVETGRSVSVYDTAVKAVNEYLATELRTDFHEIITAWNDSPKRTKEEVVAALRRAAETKGPRC